MLTLIIINGIQKLGVQHFFMQIGYEIFSTVILSLLLIQEGQFLVSGKWMCTSIG